MPSIKLILSYHKPDVLLKDDVLTPVNAGRALAKQRLAADDPKLTWLMQNTIGDDTGENISEKNATYNEMTSVYWAWKNYAALGDPDYIGFMHYRRHFLFKDGLRPQLEVTNLGSDDNYLSDTLGYTPEALDGLLAEADFIYVRPQQRPSMREHFRANHHPPDLDLAMEIVAEKYPQFVESSTRYLDGQDAIFCNMFIMPKKMFFEYADFVFSVLFELEARADLQGRRMFVSEWLTAIFVTEMLARGYRGKSLPFVIAEGDHTVPVVVAASATFVQPLSVTLTSLLMNAAANTKYDVYVLVNELYPPAVHERILDLEQQFPGTAITFVEVGDELDAISVTTEHVMVHTYYRLLIPTKLPELSRCIYLDTDVVVERDLTPLFRLVVDDKYLAAVYAAGYHVRPDERAQKIGLPSYDQYFNAGVLLMNLDRIRRDGLPTRFVELSQRGGFESDDQDILNITCYGAVRNLPLRFNVQTKYSPANQDEFFAYTGVTDCWTREEWEQAVKAPVVIHYADKRKPWLDASVDFADRWWHYAMVSPLHDEIVQDCLVPALTAAQEKIGSYRRFLVNARRGKASAERKVASLENKVANLQKRPEARQLQQFHDAVIANAKLERDLQRARSHQTTAQKTLKDVQHSTSFKVGRLLTLAPRKARALLRPAASRPGSPAGSRAATNPGSTSAGSRSSSQAPKPTAKAPQDAGPRGGQGKLKPKLKRAAARIVPSSHQQANANARAQTSLIRKSNEDLARGQLSMESKVASIESKVTGLDASLGAIMAAIGGLENRIAGLGQSMAGLTERVSEKTTQTAEARLSATVRELVEGQERRMTASLSQVADQADALAASVNDIRGRTTSALRAADEMVWSSVFHDTIRDSAWYRDQTISPGRWAVGYPTLYVLYRLLDEMAPKSILELGLGQSTRMIAQYASAAGDVHHVVAEHDAAWVDFYQRKSPILETTEVKVLELTEVPFREDEGVLRYSGFKEAILGPFDLVLVDGPFGGQANQFARIDVLDLIPEGLSKSFAIVMDDFNRPGETNTVGAIRAALTAAGREFAEAEYTGSKTMWLGTSTDLGFFTSL